MTDGGFSQPDPAPVPGQEPGPGMQLVPEGGSMLDYISDAVDCRNCEHYQVCGIIAAVRPMLDNWEAGAEDEEAPIDPIKLAVICGAFVPAEVPEE